SAAESLHSLPVPGPAIRSEDAAPRRIFIPRTKRNSGRDHNLCAGHCSVCVARVALEPDHLAGWWFGYYLHSRGRDQDRQHHATVSDDCDLDWHGDRVCSCGLSVIPDLSFGHALSVAGKMGKLEAVDFSFDPHKRYTFWSGLIGGFFLALSYFGADQSQVQRYLAGGSLKESRFGLLFNAVVKVPMQFFILLLGAVVFMFYQFEKPPVYFNQPAYERAVERGYAPQLAMLQTQFDDVFGRK